MDNFDIGTAAEYNVVNYLKLFEIKSERTGDSTEHQTKSQDIRYWDNINKIHYASVKSGYGLKLRLFHIDGECNLIGQLHNEIDDTLNLYYDVLFYVNPDGTIYPLETEAVKRYIENYKLPKGLSGDFIMDHLLNFHKKDLWLGVQKAEHRNPYRFDCYLTRSGEYSREKDYIGWKISIEKNTDDDYSVLFNIPVVGYKLEENVPFAKDYLKSLAGIKVVGE